MNRYMVCMIPHELSEYHGYVVLGVYGRNEYDATLNAEHAAPNCYVDDITSAESFATWYPHMHARFEAA